MNNKETKQHLQEWVKSNHGTFSWPTDACGYNQHMKFVLHRNNNWQDYYDENCGGENTVNDIFNKFVLEYTEGL